jgi:hypothetical protein
MPMRGVFMFMVAMIVAIRIAMLAVIVMMYRPLVNRKLNPFDLLSLFAFEMQVEIAQRYL